MATSNGATARDNMGLAVAPGGSLPTRCPKSARKHLVGVFIRFSRTEFGALLRALRSEHQVARRRPILSEWARELLVAHASQVLGVEVTRASLLRQKRGAADWKRWRLAKAVRGAAKRRRRIR